MKGERKCHCGGVFLSRTALEVHCKGRRREHYEEPERESSLSWHPIAFGLWAAPAERGHVWVACEPWALPMLAQPEKP